MSKRINVLVVGTGNQGKTHAHNIQRYPGARVAGVVGEKSFQKEVEEFVSIFGDEETKVFFNLADALSDKSLNLDAVAIASPDDTHHPFILQSLKAGIKDIFSEKPIGVGLAQLNEIKEEVKKHTSDSAPRIFCGFQRRFDNDFVTLKQNIDSGNIGKIEIMRIIARDPIDNANYNPPPSDQFVVYNSLIHDLDLTHWILQEDPSFVYATRKTYPDSKGPNDIIIVLLKFPSGRIATIEWTKGIEYGYVQSIEVMGEVGMVKVEDSQANRVHLFKAQDVGWNSAPTKPFFRDRYREAYNTEMLHFLDLVKDRKLGHNKLKGVVDLEDCYHAAKTADLIIEAIGKSTAVTKDHKGEFIVEEVPHFPKLDVKDWVPLKDKVLNIALVGAGRMGSIRAETIARHPRAKLAYVVDVWQPSRDKVAERFGGKPVATLEEALKDPSVNAIWIAVGTIQHCETIKLAAASGKPIFIEKPVALTQKEIYESFEAVAKAGIPMMVGWNRRHDPHFRKLNEMSKESSFGGPRYITTVCGDHPLGPTQLLIQLGSIFQDLMVHDIDISSWFTQDLPDNMFAMGHTFIDELRAANAGILDTALLVMNWEKKGVTAFITARRKSRHGYDQRVEVIGRTGQLLFADNPLKSTVVHKTTSGSAHDKISYTFDDRYFDSYANELDNFINLVIGNTDPNVPTPKPSTFEESFNVSLITDAALKSTRGEKIIVFKKD